MALLHAIQEVTPTKWRIVEIDRRSESLQDVSEPVGGEVVAFRI